MPITPKNEELEDWKHATWQFILEHCDVQHTGGLFVKFGTAGRANFENRVRARLNGYHREDIGAKAQKVVDARVAHKEKKKQQHANWKIDRDERMQALDIVKRRKARMQVLKKLLAKVSIHI